MAETYAPPGARAEVRTQYSSGRYRTAVRRLLRKVYRIRWKVFPPDYTRTYRLKLNGLSITVLPTVFHPKWHFTSGFFAQYCSRAALLKNADVFEVGTGTGIVALSAAAQAKRVVATDINPAAVECAKQNVRNNGLQSKVDIKLGDMFEPVAAERFDVILCNPPYFRGEARTDVERAYFGGKELEWISRFAVEARRHLKAGGRMLCVFGDAADIGSLAGLIEKEGWKSRRLATKGLPVEELSIWEFTPCNGG